MKDCDHVWVDVTPLHISTREYICRKCGMSMKSGGYSGAPRSSNSLTCPVCYREPFEVKAWRNLEEGWVELRFRHAGEERMIKVSDQAYQDRYIAEPENFYRTLRNVAEEIHDIRKYEPTPEETGESLMAAVLDRRKAFKTPAP
jgi:hypothetical protein